MPGTHPASFPPVQVSITRRQRMAAIHILDDSFEAAAQVAQLLARRRVAADRGVKPGTGVQVLVASAAAEAKMGGARGLAEMARGCGAKSLVVVAEGAAEFAVVEEMGGRI